MWKKEKTITIKGATIEELWDTHSDVKNWAKWQKDIEWTKVDGEIKKGTFFTIKPKSGPKVKLEILEYNKPEIFTDLSHLPLAKMYTSTVMKAVEEGVEIRLIIEMKGVLTFLWKKVIAKNILDGHQQQNIDMIEYIQNNRR